MTAALRRAVLALSALAAGCSSARLAGWLTPVAGTRTLEGLAYGPLPRHRLDLTLPPSGAETAPVLVFFHGGGWESGTRRDYAFVSRVLAARGLVVAMPDYRLWPDGRWPDFVEDAARAVAWLRGQPTLPQGPLFLAGHSAGGFLAAALALDPRWLAAASLPGGRESLACGVLFAAPIFWQPDKEPLVSIFAGAPGGRIAAYGAPEDLAGAPPMLLLHGTADTTVGPFHSERLAEALAAAGRPVRLRLFPDMAHIAILGALSYPMRAMGWVGEEVLEEVVGFVRG